MAARIIPMLEQPLISLDRRGIGHIEHIVDKQQVGDMMVIDIFVQVLVEIPEVDDVHLLEGMEEV